MLCKFKACNRKTPSLKVRRFMNLFISKQEKHIKNTEMRRKHAPH